MRSIFPGWPVVITGLLVLLFIVSCTPDNTVIRKQDHPNATTIDRGEDTDYEEENYNFDDGEQDSPSSDKKANVDNEDADGADRNSSYKKEKYYQTGMASWYGREFHGKKTASGERFDMNKLTAAHKTLPFGTVISVKNFDNGKTVTVRINDRGPYRGNRVIDLSYSAAKRLGMLKDGQIQVGVKILKRGAGLDQYEGENESESGLEAVSDDGSGESSAGKGSFAIQTGAFYSKRNAENLKMKIEQLTNNSVVIIHDNDMFKVRIEGLDSKMEANRLKDTLSSEDIPSYLINKNE
ncbi:MAG: hypothetical protein A2176_13740 [Spirochaetes bacterium RBG_13_51_14]|nr:MAG: hypothetical protein A2176_13740 [Spirochaetes bacterium RBG_13_51_14]